MDNKVVEKLEITSKLMEAFEFLTQLKYGAHKIIKEDKRCYTNVINGF